MTAIVALVAGHRPLLAAGLAAALIGFRIGAEYLVPRSHKLRAADEIGDREAAIRTALAKLAATTRGRVPESVAAGIDRVSRRVLDLVDRESGMATGSRELFSVLGTATDYLPQAVENYCRLPREYAMTRQLEGGLTATEVLLQQLDLLDAEMVAVADAVSRNDLDRLLAHGRFLNDRFGRSELDFGRSEA